MNRLLAIFAAVLLIILMAHPGLTTDSAAATPDKLFCSGFEACPPYCGNGSLDPGEACDDGNQVDGDGCSANCLSDETCGNFVTDHPVGETCDDGNTEDGDGCSAVCQLGCVQDNLRVCDRTNANGSCTGFEACNLGLWGSCSAPEPSTEVCDNIDNDCDGVTDEGFSGLGDSCSAGVGACQQPGVLVCDPGNPAGPPICSATPGVPGSESCNGIDDDCDGVVDNGVPSPLCANQSGVCVNSAKLCAGTIGYLECAYAEYGSDYEPVELSCDGLDNDCDGLADNGLPLQLCSAQEGVCAGSVKTCGGENLWQECGPAEYGPDFEAVEVTCDYKDNDCDGQVDEPFDLATDLNNCGYCGYVCASPPHSNPYCEFSACGYTCETGYSECDYDPTNGCETFGSCP